MAAKRIRFLQELRRKTINSSEIQSDDDNNISPFSKCLENVSEVNLLTAGDYEMTDVSSELKNVNQIDFSENDVILEDDLHLSDDSVADPNFEIFNNLLEGSDTDWISDSEDETTSCRVTTSALIHNNVTTTSREQTNSNLNCRGDNNNIGHVCSPLNDNYLAGGHLNNYTNEAADLSSVIPIPEVQAEVSISNSQVINKRKGRSRNERENSKKLRNSGQGYVTEKGKKVPDRCIKPLSSCRLKCSERFSEIERKHNFDEYWSLGSRDRRAMYVASLISIFSKKTQKTDSRTTNRDCYCKYKLIIDNEDRAICKECFCKTLGETKGFVNIVMEKKKYSSNGIIPVDTRGRQPSKNKRTVDDVSTAKNHILSFPNYESHYCRTRTNRKYLAADLSIAAMYRLYKEICQNPISLKLYSQCFHDLNLSFKSPAKDTCHTCDLLNTKISLAEGEESLNLKVELTEHQSQAEKAYTEKRKDKNNAKSDPSIRVYTFDLQQCLPTPYLKTSVSFYKRQLWSFNLTIHDLANNKGTCYMWDETIGARGANQIASCLWHFLWNLPPEAKHVIFYSDTCGGQNKNNIVAMMFMYLLHLHPTLETISHKFLISGHSHMECDSDHAIIERMKKKTQLKINHLNDWMQLVRSCKIKNAFTVVPMTLDCIYDFAELSSKKGPFSIKKKDTSGNKYLWQPIKWLKYTKPVGEILFKTAIDSESFLSVNYKKRGKCNLDGFKLEVVSKVPLAISKEKKKDLMDLLPLIDPAFHEFFKNIKTDSTISNNDPDLDEEDPDLHENGEQQIIM